MGGIPPLEVRMSGFRKLQRNLLSLPIGHINGGRRLQVHLFRRSVENFQDDVQSAESSLNDALQVRHSAKSPFFNELRRDFLHTEEEVERAGVAFFADQDVHAMPDFLLQFLSVHNDKALAAMSPKTGDNAQVPPLCRMFRRDAYRTFCHVSAAAVQSNRIQDEEEAQVPVRGTCASSRFQS